MATQARPAPHFRLAAGERMGPFEIVKPLGAGGMGEVIALVTPA